MLQTAFAGTVPGGGAGPFGNLLQPAPAVPSWQLPEWVSLGARVAYRTSESHQPVNNPQAGNAALGMETYDVLAVTPGFLIVGVEALLQDGLNTGRLDYAGATTQILDETQIVAGGTFFVPPAALAQMQSGQGVEVQRGPYPFGDQTVDAVMITVRVPNAVVRQVYEAQTGLKLYEISASGALRSGAQGNEFMRETTSTKEFVGYRQTTGLVQQHPWPEWAQQVSLLTYSGQMVHSMQGFTNAVPMQTTIRITERGPDWVLGTATTVMQMAGAAPSEYAFGHGMGGLGQWVGPAALAALPAGVVDRDPYTGTQIAYRAEGAQGVFTTQYTGGTRITVVYDLQSGVLQFMQMEVPMLFQTLQLQLINAQ